MAAGQIIYAPQHIIIPAAPLGGTQPLPDGAPSAAAYGHGLIDPRPAYSPASPKAGVQAFFSEGFVKVVGQAPSAISTTNIAAAQHTVNGTPMTLVSTTGSGITVLASPFYCFGSGNTIPTGSLAIDGVPTYTPFGQSFISNFYSPGGGLSRGVSVTAAAGATATSVLVKGADIYGYPMSQAISVTAGSTVASLKDFKFIYSATPTGTDSSHNYSIGTADVFGFGIVCNIFPDALIYWNNVLQLVATFTAPDATTPATTATGGVRGTVGPFGSASNGTIKLDLYVRPSLGDVSASSLTVGLFGQTQV